MTNSEPKLHFWRNNCLISFITNVSNGENYVTKFSREVSCLQSWLQLCWFFCTKFVQKIGHFSNCVLSSWSRLDLQNGQLAYILKAPKLGTIHGSSVPCMCEKWGWRFLKLCLLPICLWSFSPKRCSFINRKIKYLEPHLNWKQSSISKIPNTVSYTVKEEIFVGEKCRTFPSNTFHMEFNFVLSSWPKNVKREETIERPANKEEGNLVWKLISYIFQLYESHEIKFHTKISSFTVWLLHHVSKKNCRWCSLMDIMQFVDGHRLLKAISGFFWFFSERRFYISYIKRCAFQKGVQRIFMFAFPRNYLYQLKEGHKSFQTWKFREEIPFTGWETAFETEQVD